MTRSIELHDREEYKRSMRELLTIDPTKTVALTVDMQREEVWRVKPSGEWIESAPVHEKVMTRTVLAFIVALGIFTYHSVYRST